MIDRLLIRNVGPIKEKALDFGGRINVFTGDNGLAKTFLLDLIWFALTRKWPADVNKSMNCGLMALPGEANKAAMISVKMQTERGRMIDSYESRFDKRGQFWRLPAGRRPSAGLVIYAHADGSFSVWDQARNYWSRSAAQMEGLRTDAYVFSPREVWSGLWNPRDPLKPLCNGLIRDWASWQKGKDPEFELLREVLRCISPSEDENDLLVPGELTRIGLDDARDYPTIHASYGDVPIVMASAAVRRIVSLAYFLVWVFREHYAASQLLGRRPSGQIVLLIDEIESHLHPKWQRSVVDGVLSAVDSLQTLGGKMLFPQANVQLFLVTHSPLVMTALEDAFDDRQDAWFDMDKVKGSVAIEKRPFDYQSNAESWLVSRAFDLKTTRSRKCEKAYLAARSVLSEALRQETHDIDSGLRKRLQDAFSEASRIMDPADEFLLRYKCICDALHWNVR